MILVALPEFIQEAQTIMRSFAISKRLQRC
jgi:hypothetical protein